MSAVPPGYVPPSPDGNRPIVDFNQRPILDLSALCIPIPELPTAICFTFPGGATICIPHDRPSIGVLEYATKAMMLANAAIAPLKPVLDVIDFAMSILDTLGAVPGVLTNPKPLIDQLKKLANKAIPLAKLLPPVSLLVLLFQLLGALIAILNGFANEFESLARLGHRIEAAQFAQNQRAPGLAQLITCAQSQYRVQLNNLAAAFASINGVIQIINLVGELTKAKGFPIKLTGDGTYSILTDGYGEPLQAAAALHQVTETLQKLQALIAIPDRLV